MSTRFEDRLKERKARAKERQARAKERKKQKAAESSGQLLDKLQEGRKSIFANTRSNITRRNIDGSIIDESKPSGLDAMRDIPHSWERTYNNQGMNPRPAEASPFEVRTGDKLKSVQGAYGGGFAAQPGASFKPTPVETASENPKSIFSKVPVANQRDQHLRNIQAAYNLTSPGEQNVNPVLYPKLAAKTSYNLLEPASDMPTYSSGVDGGASDNLGLTKDVTPPNLPSPEVAFPLDSPKDTIFKQNPQNMASPKTRIAPQKSASTPFWDTIISYLGRLNFPSLE